MMQCSLVGAEFSSRQKPLIIRESAQVIYQSIHDNNTSGPVSLSKAFQKASITTDENWAMHTTKNKDSDKLNNNIY